MSQQDTLGQKVVKVLQSSAAAAVVAGVATYVLLGERASINIFGKSIPIALAVGGAILAGEIASHAALPYIFKYMPFGKRFIALETGLTAAAISGGVAVAVLMLASGASLQDGGLVKIFTLGAASAFIGDSINTMIFAAEFNKSAF